MTSAAPCMTPTAWAGEPKRRRPAAPALLQARAVVAEAYPREVTAHLRLDLLPEDDAAKAVESVVR